MYRFFVKGVVQGVGFRPFVYTKAKAADLRGYVQNIGGGVIIVADKKQIMEKILCEPPPLARIDSITISETSEDLSDFSIRESKGTGYAEIPPDISLCDDCLHELRDTRERRKDYFFTTCTNCGPRFSIAITCPYDRATTTMTDFQMCATCQQEYTQPENRRYHAQTIACHDCGPRLYFNRGGGIREACEAIKKGELVAIKGIGGFHLVCKYDEETVSRLRKITGRPHKPYALMVRDIAMLQAIANPTKEELALLLSEQCPIVLIKKKQSFLHVSELDTLGIMLPYTALHYLLFDHYHEPLVMTSANLPDAPIAHTDEQVFVDAILTNTRRIENAIDDSVMKVIKGVPFFLRRSRGFVPQSISLDAGSGCYLALGADMGNTICVYKNGKAYLSQYLGNLWNPQAYERFQSVIRKFLKMLDAQPSIVLGDTHPQFFSRTFGQLFANENDIPFVSVQHHLAHVYGVAAEHGLQDFVGIACDGVGYGMDGTLWGGEIFDNGTRIGHLEQHIQLGGDAATVHPERMAYAILRKFLPPGEIMTHLKWSENTVAVYEKQYKTGFNSFPTTSCGRILDAAAAILGLCSERTYDGRPAMLLEAHSTDPYDISPVISHDILLTTPLFQFLVQNLDKDKGRLAATVQFYLAKGLYVLAAKRKKPIVFAGGCAYNRIMTSFMLEKGVLVNKKVPPGDGGISFGQIAYQTQAASSQ